MKKVIRVKKHLRKGKVVKAHARNAKDNSISSNLFNRKKGNRVSHAAYNPPDRTSMVRVKDKKAGRKKAIDYAMKRFAYDVDGQGSAGTKIAKTIDKGGTSAKRAFIAANAGKKFGGSHTITGKKRKRNRKNPLA